MHCNFVLTRSKIKLVLVRERAKCNSLIVPSPEEERICSITAVAKTLATVVDRNASTVVVMAAELNR
jgi:hypothetical protein